MKLQTTIPTAMLAPCGMNCVVCYVHLRKKKACEGCRGRGESQPDHCQKCHIRNCANKRGINFCFECSAFPCAMIKRLDKSYRQRYQVSLIENGIRIRTVGAKQFVIEEKQKWTCAQCGCMISLHDRVCSECGSGMG